MSKFSKLKDTAKEHASKAGAVAHDLVDNVNQVLDDVRNVAKEVEESFKEGYYGQNVSTDEDLAVDHMDIINVSVPHNDL